MLMVTVPEAAPRRGGGQLNTVRDPGMQEVCGTSDLEIGWGYVKQTGIVGGDRRAR
jgi:hypothetical protein